jgi:hypothetical protein
MKTLVDRHRYHRGRVAQWIARMPTEHEVDGSTPSVVGRFTYFCMVSLFFYLGAFVVHSFHDGFFCSYCVGGVGYHYLFSFGLWRQLLFRTSTISVDLRLLLLCLFLILFSLVLSSLAHFLCRQDGSKETILGRRFAFLSRACAEGRSPGKETMQKGGVVCFRNV